MTDPCNNITPVQQLHHPTMRGQNKLGQVPARHPGPIPAIPLIRPNPWRKSLIIGKSHPSMSCRGKDVPNLTIRSYLHFETSVIHLILNPTCPCSKMAPSNEHYPRRLWIPIVPRRRLGWHLVSNISSLAVPYRVTRPKRKKCLEANSTDHLTSTSWKKEIVAEAHYGNLTTPAIRSMASVRKSKTAS